MAPYLYTDQEWLCLLDRFLLSRKNYGTHYQVKSEFFPRFRHSKKYPKSISFHLKE